MSQAVRVVFVLQPQRVYNIRLTFPRLVWSAASSRIFTRARNVAVAIASIARLPTEQRVSLQAQIQ